jgi:adenine deaminase
MFLHNPDNRKLVETALGNVPADLIIKDGALMDVYSGRILYHRSIAVSGQWIAYVGPDAGHMIGPETRVIEAGGRPLVPGYIDAHTHVANYCDLADFLTYAMAGGTTTLITEVETFGLALGAEGFRIFLDYVRNRPVKILCLIPPMISLSPALAPRLITPDEAEELLEDEQVIGLGESYWQNAILTPDNRVLALIQRTTRAGKTVQGHSAGAADRKLAAYAAAGAVSCHEAISPEDILARLEMGYAAIIREGYIRRDLEKIRPVLDQIDTRRCALCTDGADPQDLVTKGYLVNVIQKAVDLGIPFMEALRMVTLNPAEYLGLSHLIGGLAPGRYADILILPEPGVMQPDMVISSGRLIAEGGAAVIPLAKVTLPERITRSINIPRVSGEDFIVAASLASRQTVRTLAIQPNGLVARESAAEIPKGRREICADPHQDLLKLAFIESVSGKGARFTGLVNGWGQSKGAVATSLCWDSAGIVAIGCSDEDLAMAVNAVIDMQGGIALALDGAVSMRIPYPIAGYISDLPIKVLIKKVADLQDALHRLGVGYASPLLSLIVMTSAAIPFIRITEKGYFRFRENDYVGL